MAVAETKVAVTAVPTTAAGETTIAVSDTVSWASAGGLEGLIVRGVLNITAGTGTTAVTLRVRKGSGTGGNQVGVNLPYTLAAGASASIAYEVLDATPVANVALPSGAQSVPTNLYTVTVQQTGGTGAGTVNYGTIGIETAANVG